jgi:hypothetical protein
MELINFEGFFCIKEMQKGKKEPDTSLHFWQELCIFA